MLANTSSILLRLSRSTGKLICYTERIVLIKNIGGNPAQKKQPL